MEKYSRTAVKLSLLFFAIYAVFDTQTGGDVVRPITAGWMLLSAMITGLREVRRGYHPRVLAIIELALCIVGILWVVAALTVAYYDLSQVPSPGTLFGFLAFWAVHIVLMIERVRYLKAMYVVPVLVGILGFLGNVLDVAVLKYQFDDTTTGMALPTAVFLILLGAAAYSRERQGP